MMMTLLLISITTLIRTINKKEENRNSITPPEEPAWTIIPEFADENC